MLYRDTVILVFAKAPVEGEVNTRLIPDIGVQAATRLQEDLIHDRLSMLTESGLCDVRLLCAPNQQHEKFSQYKNQYPITLFGQSGANLGQRMFNGVSSALRQYRYCIVIGTDAPALDMARIKQAVEVLHAGCDVAIVPAEDGGYVLIAMQQAHEFLFDGINWGGEQVMSQTRKKLDENKLSVEVLSCCWDVDRLEDYQRYLATKVL